MMVMLFLLGFAVFVVGSRNLQSLTLDEAVDLAVRQSLVLQRNRIDLDTAEFAASNRIFSELFPSVSASAGISYGSNLFTGDGFRFEDRGLSYTLTLGANFSLRAGLPHALRIISLAYQTSLLTYEEAERQLKIRVAKDFYRLITEQKRLDLLQENLNLAERQMERNRALFQNGIISQREYLQSRLSVETSKLNLSRAAMDYELAMMDFFTVLGLDIHADVSLDGVIEIEEINVDAEALILTHLARRPDIIRQRQNIERLEATRSQTLLDNRAPSVSLSSQWRGGGNPTISDSFSDNLTALSLTLSIPIDPWIPATRGGQAVRRAGAEIEKARLDLQNTQNLAKNQVRSLAAALRNSWSTIEISRLQVDIAEQTYRLTEQAFQVGAVEFTILESTRTDLSRAQQQLLADQSAYKQTMLDLAGSLNLELDEFLVLVTME
jgi:outer membrane protein TolC